jgi:predicted dehydrogenase
MVRLGIIGTSKITQELLKAVAQASETVGVTAQAVYSRDLANGQRFAHQQGIPSAYDSLADMLGSDIDAVYVASPNKYHMAHAIQAMEAGKHVLVEKPMASNAREAAAMIAVAKRQGVLLMEAMKSTVQPGMQAIRDALPRIGVPRKVIASYCQYSSRYDAFKAGDIQNAFKPELSNGALMDIGCYTLYPIIELFGAPDHVHASGTLLHTGVDGSGTVTMRYASGLETVSIYSKIADSHLPTEIQGEAGTLLIDRINEPREVTFIPRGGEREALPVLQTSHGMLDEVLHFVDGVERGLLESPINRHDCSLQTLKVMDAARAQLGVHYPADNL